jgi:hypothetical protein
LALDREEWSNSHRLLYAWERTPVPTKKEAGWAHDFLDILNKNNYQKSGISGIFDNRSVTAHLYL